MVVVPPVPFDHTALCDVKLPLCTGKWESLPIFVIILGRIGGESNTVRGLMGVEWESFKIKLGCMLSSWFLNAGAINTVRFKGSFLMSCQWEGYSHSFGYVACSVTALCTIQSHC